MFKRIRGILIALEVVTFAVPAVSADGLKGQPTVAAKAALERYTANGGSSPWVIESVEIHGSLDKLGKTADLRATRRLTGTSDAKYDAVQFTGDRTVLDQVIVRYLNGEQQASKMASPSVAITPANYRFTFKRVVDDGEYNAFVFQITPRHKRQGLIKGELWLDQQSGLPVRQSGYFVKSPSIFIKRIAVDREDTLQDGTVESHLTHITVDTRLIGRAELVIKERPVQPASPVQLADSDAEGGQQ